MLGGGNLGPVGKHCFSRIRHLNNAGSWKCRFKDAICVQCPLSVQLYSFYPLFVVANSKEVYEGSNLMTGN